MLGKRLIKSNDAGGGGCINTVDLYNPFPDGGGVALYQLNGDATDVSGNHNGTWVGTPAYGTGQFGQAAVFNGTNNYISLGASNSFGISDSITFSIWVRFKDNDNEFIAGNYPGGSYGTGQFYIQRNHAQNKLIVQIYSGSGYQVDCDFTFNTNEWYNITYTKSASVGSDQFYVNSIAKNTSLRDGTLGSGTILNNSNTLSLANTNTISAYANIDIDQVRIFSRALRPYEVEALYTEEYCTPTIVPSEHFNTVTYDGQATDKQVTGVGFQPDLVWVKCRDVVNNHVLADSVRGGNGTAYYSLFSNLTNAESSSNQIKSLDLDGFTIWGDRSATNRLNQTYVAWNFKAGGAAVTNTDGTITSQVSANTEAGFSIVSWTGSGSAANIGHGLNDVPSVVIVKNRDRSPTNWAVYHVGSVFGGTTPQETVIYLNVTNSNSDNYSMWNDTAPTSSVFTVNTNEDVNWSGNSMIAYCFAEVEGFSNFGSYVGTGNTVNVVTGFEPAMIIIKRTDSIEDWKIIDNKRGDFANSLEPNEAIAEEVNNNSNFTLSANGFTIGDTSGDYNASGGKYIYMAFAADPTAVEPTLEDSFNTVTYTGNGYPNSGTQTITDVGFQPDFTWFKSRNFSTFHLLYDSVRGTNKQLYTNSTSAEVTDNGTNVLEWTDTGFNLGSDSNGDGLNRLDSEMVAWNWKGAEIPAINSNGSIPSVVSANPAAGFSIVSYRGNSTNGATVGHGLGVEPSIVIFKNRSITSNWAVYSKELGVDYTLFLNSTDAKISVSNKFAGTNSSVIGLNSAGDVNSNSIIAYCFAEVAGFSKFGSYNGGSTNTIVTGFEPAFLMVKRTNGDGNWYMYDNKRDTTNPIDKALYANLSNAESTLLAKFQVNFETNGFSYEDTTGGSVNASGGTYIYMAFADQF